MCFWVGGIGVEDRSEEVMGKRRGEMTGGSVSEMVGRWLLCRCRW